MDTSSVAVYNLFLMVSFFLGFSFLYKVIDSEYFVSVPLKSRATKYLTWSWKSYMLGMVHSPLVFFGLMYCWIKNPNLMYDPINNENDQNAPWFLMIEIAYLSFDLYDLVMHGTEKERVLIIHHALVIPYYLVDVLYYQNCGLSVILLGTDFSTAVLDIRFLLNCFGKKDTTIYKIVRIISFPSTLTRNIFSLLFFYHAYEMHLQFNSIIHNPITMLIGAKCKGNVYLEWSWKRYMMAIVHSSLSSFTIIYCWTKNPALLFDPNNCHDESLSWILALESGYLTYDLYDLLMFSGKYGFKERFSFFHHVFSIPYLTFVVWLGGNYPLSTIMLGTEISTVFLHLRFLFTRFDKNDSFVFKLLQYITFPMTLTRFVFTTLFIYHGFYLHLNIYSIVYNPIWMCIAIFFFNYFNYKVSYSYYRKDFVLS